MVRTVLVCAGVLGLAGPGDPPPGDQPKASAATPDAGADLTARLAKYNALREKAPETAAAQWNLALWCEQNGLKAEAQVHYATVVRLDSARDAAWRKLGFTKRDGRWLDADELAEDDEQKKADKVWAPQLKKIHKEIHAGGKKQTAAEDALTAIEEPRAVPTIYREFSGGATDQLIAIRALGHLATPLSSRLLAALAVYGRTPEVRRQATESLRARDPDDFLEVLVGLMSEPVKYEVRPVGGSGVAGVLFIEGEKANVRRVYFPPPPPTVTPQYGDMIGYDRFGMPVIERPVNPAAMQYAPIRGTRIPNSGMQVFRAAGEMVRFSATDALVEAQTAVVSAQKQLDDDVAALDEMNERRKKFNELLIRAAKDATDKNLETPAVWRDALPKRPKYAGPDRKPTVDELVPPAYRPLYLVQRFAVQFKVAPFG
jgi:hypothetical protein